MHLLPFSYAKQSQLVLTAEGDLLVTPATDLTGLLEVYRVYGYPRKLVKVSVEEFGQILRETYSQQQTNSESVMDDINSANELQDYLGEFDEQADLLASEDDAPVIRLLNAIFMEAVREKASDIHIELYQDSSRVRYRLDGVLKTVLEPPTHVAPLLVSRIKVLARLDIAEKRLPQDGRMSISLGGRSIDLRVSTMPSGQSERVVLRLMDKNAGQLRLDDLGMDQANFALLQKIIKRPHGIVLVTGPTGSGKTTTLYAALQSMDCDQRNVMTVEDPVEYHLSGISQSQVNSRAGMTFAKGLRAILRQDPDVILIGEIRDNETAQIATQASLTGHLVLSTLHTNTASGAVTRMQDLGVDSFLLSSTLGGVVAQRLVRKLCGECREAIPAEAKVAELLQCESGATIFHAAGCSQCNNTGYIGRQSLFEVVTVDEGLRRLIHDRAGETEIESYVRKQTPSLFENGLNLVRQGVTTLEEVLRVTSL
ncbi:MAG: type II secretion system ATPase GspE [Pseudomonadales bacterium]